MSHSCFPRPWHIRVHKGWYGRPGALGCFHAASGWCNNMQALLAMHDNIMNRSRAGRRGSGGGCATRGRQVDSITIVNWDKCDFKWRSSARERCSLRNRNTISISKIKMRLALAPFKAGQWREFGGTLLIRSIFSAGSFSIYFSRASQWIQ